MSNLYERWSWERRHIPPFDSFDESLLKRSDVSSRYFQGSVRRSTIHPLAMRAIQTYLELEQGNTPIGRTHQGAIGSQGNDFTIAEYPSSNGEVQVVI